MSERPVLTVTAAVNAFEIERRTLQRMLSAEQLPGSFKDSRGRWKVPVEALQAAGFVARKTWFDGTTDDTTVRDSDATLTPEKPSLKSKTLGKIDATERDKEQQKQDKDATDLRQHIARLEAQLDAEKRLREAAERNAEDLRNAMRMLETSQPRKIEESTVLEPVRRRWWKLS